MKKIIVLASLILFLMVPIAMGDEAYSKEDFQVLGEGFTVMKVTGRAAKNISKQCECSVAILEQEKLIFLLFPEEVTL
jgi:hypothetical protein